MDGRLPRIAACEAHSDFTWLPDAPLDPHPRLSWLVQCGFDVVLHALCQRIELVPADYALEPGTLVVSNHERDMDVPVIAAALCRREGLRLRWPLPFFASREDMFRPGFLGELLAHWRSPLPALLSQVPLGWLLRVIRVQPMRRVRYFSFGEALAACLANAHAPKATQDTLNARGQREVRAVLRELPPRIDALLAEPRLAALLRQLWGLRRLRPDARRALLPQHRAQIRAQLAHFAALLDAGRVVYFAAEGGKSESGKLGAFRAGMWRVSRLAASSPPVLPIAVSYDPLRTGRLRVLVHLGTPMRALDMASQRSYDIALRRAILTLYPITASHLASHYLVAGPVRFTTAQFAAWLSTAAQAARAAGLTVDPLLAPDTAEDLAGRRLGWLACKRLVRRAGATWRNCWPREAPPGWSTPAEIVRYLDNSLGDVSAEAAASLQP